MGFKEAISKLRGNGGAREAIGQLSEQMRIQRLAEERQLSSNERELNRLMNEEREKMIKEQLDFARKKRQHDIDFGHNPLNAKNIMKSEWEVLKEKNQFAHRGNVFQGQKSVLKNDNKLLKSNNNLLKNNDKLLKGGNMFKG